MSSSDEEPSSSKNVLEDVFGSDVTDPDDDDQEEEKSPIKVKKRARIVSSSDASSPRKMAPKKVKKVGSLVDHSQNV